MHILGGASVHIKAIGSTPIPHQSKTSSEGIWGQYLLSMLGRTLKEPGYEAKLTHAKYNNYNLCK